ncbi:MAG: DNA topoisomerase I [Nitrososphaerota archaeon]|jgi:DNA topoisomerase-1|nr:DNA topoisomerase I [Nitrososphaerota archaeon]MDG6935790.1 DNA topoisomerase I [Nitrososphaerota archaeon]
MSKKIYWNELKHNGIYVPEPYLAKGIPLIIEGKRVTLGDEGELMALNFAGKVDKYIDDDIFIKNFEHDFKKTLPPEFRKFSVKQMDFTEFKNEIERQKAAKKTMTKEEKLMIRAENQKLKEKYGYAELDGEKVPLSTWRMEVPGLFIGRGNHPLRGRWKPPIMQKDIVINLSKNAPVPPGKWKGIVHRPDVLWVAYWDDPLIGKEKYVWFHESVNLMQERNRAKYDSALELGRKIEHIRKRIMKDMKSRDPKIRKTATVAYLIDSLCMRVGDEKEKDEADTVGATTLRKEHVKILENEIKFRFLGKDSVLWEKSLNNPPDIFLENFRYFTLKSTTGQVFEGINSRIVNRYLGSIAGGLTAKVFRTYHGSLTYFNYLNSVKTQEISYPEDAVYHIKIANLMTAIRLNHKRTPPPTYESSLMKKEERLKYIVENPPKKITDSYRRRVKKAEMQVKLAKLIRDYNLNTSMKNYIDPRISVSWASKTNLPIDKIYSKTLIKKFEWSRRSRIKWETLERLLNPSAGIILISEPVIDYKLSISDRN